MPRGPKPIYCYTVYAEPGDVLVCLDASKQEAAKAMGVSPESIGSIINHAKKGMTTKWQIYKNLIADVEREYEEIGAE